MKPALLTAPQLTSLALCLVALAGCGGGDGGADAGVGDGAVATDGGMRALCPMLEAPACRRASECGTEDEEPSQATCAACIKTNASACVFGACQQTPPLMVADRHDVIFDARDVAARVQSFHQLAITATSAGGLVRTCEDVYENRVALDEPCNNVVESRLRTKAEGQPSGTVYTVSFSRFPSSLRTLFIVYGYDSADTSGTRIGVSCAVHDVGAPGSGIVRMDGGRMRPL
jgi:hypothetical protein